MESGRSLFLLLKAKVVPTCSLASGPFERGLQVDLYQKLRGGKGRLLTHQSRSKKWTSLERSFQPIVVLDRPPY